MLLSSRKRKHSPTTFAIKQTLADFDQKFTHLRHEKWHLINCQLAYENTDREGKLLSLAVQKLQELYETTSPMGVSPELQDKTGAKCPTASI